MFDYVKQNREEQIRLILGVVLLLFAVIYHFFLCVDTKHIRRESVEQITFYTFNELLTEGQVDTVYYTERENTMYIKCVDDVWKSTANPDTEDYKSELLSHDILVYDVNELVFAEDNEIGWRSWVWLICLGGSSTLAVMVYVGYTSSKVKAQIGQVGTNNNGGSSKSPVTGKSFDDVAGLHEVKKDLESLVDFLKNKEKYTSAGAKLPKGVIFYGPPGTGKTLLAKALATEAKVSFLYASGSDFIEMYVGVGAKRIRELFEKARKQAPCIIFIDELDAVGGKRTSSNSNDEDRKAINALLTEMDGFKDSENILVIGATNRLEDLDSALVRPGRFTDKFCIPAPQTISDRKEVLNLYMENKRFSEDVLLDELAREASGFTPAQIEAWLNESAILSVQRGSSYITKKFLDDAMSKMVLQGHIREDQSERSMEELKIVAYHEAGHALVGMLFGSEVTKVTILSTTSGAGGVTFSLPGEKNLLSVNDIRHKVMGLYGGRASEEILGVDITTGASNDIERATDMIHSMVVRYGMDESFGVLNLERAGVDKEFILQREIALSRSLYADTIELLKLHKQELISIADRLLENETIYESDLRKILGGRCERG